MTVFRVVLQVQQVLMELLAPLVSMEQQVLQERMELQVQQVQMVQ